VSKIVFTLGYTGRSPEEVVQLLESKGAVLFDIRFSANSRNFRFNKGYLTSLLKERYQHVKQLGNVNYKGGPIEIEDYQAGRAMIAASPSPVILMCVCKDPRECHRTAVAARLRADGFTVQEIGMEAPKEKQESLL